MKKIENLLAVFLPLIFAVSPHALAYPWWPHCYGPIQEASLIATVVKYTSSCELAEPLKLMRVDHYYPLMKSVLTVDAWQGSYIRNTETDTTYRIDNYDCEGHFQFSSQAMTSEAGVASFAIDNPNLHDDVDLSFVANAGMTDGEAQAALDSAKQKCELQRLVIL
jgi:hypothetical protein